MSIWLILALLIVGGVVGGIIVYIWYSIAIGNAIARHF